MSVATGFTSAISVRQQSSGPKAMPAPPAAAARRQGRVASCQSAHAPSPAPFARQVVRADAKDIIFDNASRKKMQDGINKVADAVQVTLGPRGEQGMQWCTPRAAAVLGGGLPLQQKL